jgi:uncharacterized protein (TIGR03118 family)
MPVRRAWKAAAALAAFCAWTPGAANAAGYTQTNLVSDIAGAAITDANLVNPWGIATSSASPFWVSDNRTGVTTLYSVDPVTGAPAKVGLTVTIPGDGTVTGQVYNASAQFNGDLFIFVSEDGTISGWRGALGTTAEILRTADPANVYKGVAVATIGAATYLYAANFHTGAIDVLKGDPGNPSLTGSFTDPVLPSGYAPFNIQNISGALYVTYALQDAAKHDDVPGAGHGYVDKFDLQGNFVARLASAGALNSPWGLALAPASFGDLAGALLVGNFGDGKINAFDATTGASIGTLRDSGGAAIVVQGLWGLRFGNGGSGGATDALFFTAGIPGSGAVEDHGLFGMFKPSASAPPSLVSAVSRHVHGGAGTFDLPLTLVVPPGINHNPATEPRQGPVHTIVFTFDKPVTAATATITEGVATAGTPTFSGNNATVGLTGVTDHQYVTVMLSNVASSDGGTGGTGTARIGFLLGDVNTSRVVSVADLGLVNGQLAQTVTAANYLKDVNSSGTLTVADKGITNANLTKALPAP